ncbi:MAG: AarF/ABC1/UbiB kinase family protein [Thaumarchaeota archaeon]|nr:AarF/ABC1/UbiB kinase family protein [Nitrososphaerota archaeon]MDE1831166.1 AarF/ABC1/UbiB kinase family protein [Nitrososphaerota archaeon]MDE1841399.1 AarF/ABC1/UbiB kinase family protein [Nitrososphaerota archaeon]MDE1878008.1 AarF/ABC1/UbiB kinase family protein [Nitrososphaerota archaeon]
MTRRRTIQTFIKLIPLVLALRKDRREWVKKQGKNVDLKRYQKNARKALKTFLSLGPVYIKLGQWLSSRADILPQPYLEELAKLQDEVPAESFDKVKPIIEKDLGPMDKNFDFVDTNVISGASLGQVYKARLRGQDVIIKVKRPGIEKVVEEDIHVLKKIIPFAMKFVDPNLRYSAEAMLSQFIETINEEMDYRIESQNLKTIKKNMQSYPKLIIPSVIDDRSSKNILTMEYLPGIKITNVKALDEAGIDREQLVVRAHRIFFTMLLRHDLFHADPHPGNISVTNDGSLILYDFGMVGRLDTKTRLKLIRLYLSLIERDPIRTVSAMDDLGMLMPGYDRNIIEKGLALSIQAFHGTKVDRMEVKALMELANKTMSRFPFKLPKHLALYMRMTSILEGVYLTHKVNFRFINVLQNIMEEENIIRDAYVEELKISFGRFVKSIDAAIAVVPEIRQFIEQNKNMQTSKPKSRTVLLSGTILAAAVFVGSTILYSTNNLVGEIGMISSAVIMALAIVLKEH